MELELSLFELCEKFIFTLKELKKQSLISEEEYEKHINLKNKFIQTYINKTN